MEGLHQNQDRLRSKEVLMHSFFIIDHQDFCLNHCEAYQSVYLLTGADTRYFIVKSFNEENVMKCMEDVSRCETLHPILN